MMKRERVGKSKTKEEAVVIRTYWHDVARGCTNWEELVRGGTRW